MTTSLPSHNSNPSFQTIEDLPIMLQVEDLMQILNVGKNTAYSLIHAGCIKHLRIGRQIRIPKQALIDYLSSASF